MTNEIQLISDGDGLAVIGDSTDVERFLHDQGLDRVPSNALDLRRVNSALGTSGALVQAGSEVALNSGRWVRLTKDSAKAVAKYGLMPSKKGGIGHAMIGPRPGHSQQWLQIDKAPMLLCGPMAPVVLSTMMQQQAMQRQMDEMLEYLRAIDEKVDDILRNQKDAVIADMIGVDLIIEEAFTLRNQTGRVSETTWSKVQATSMTIARTQAYAIRQLDGIAGKLERTKDAGEMAKTAKDAEVKVREWLAVLARCFQLQDGIAVLELDRVLDAAPQELEQHRLGLAVARHNRVEVIARSTACLLRQMEETVQKANSRVLFNPLKSPAAVRSSNQVAADLLDFRGRLGIESGHQTCEAKGWGEAATEVRDQVVKTTVEGAGTAYRVGADTAGRAAEAVRAIDVDGILDKERALSAVEHAGSAIKGVAADTADVVGSAGRSAGAAVGGLVSGAAGATASVFKRKKSAETLPDELDSEAVDKRVESSDA